MVNLVKLAFGVGYLTCVLVLTNAEVLRTRLSSCKTRRTFVVQHRHINRKKHTSAFLSQTYLYLKGSSLARRHSHSFWGLTVVESTHFFRGVPCILRAEVRRSHAVLLSLCARLRLDRKVYYCGSCL